MVVFAGFCRHVFEEDIDVSSSDSVQGGSELLVESPVIFHDWYIGGSVDLQDGQIFGRWAEPSDDYPFQ